MSKRDFLIHEIEAMVKEADMGGMIVLVDPEGTSYKLMIEASWSGLKYEKTPEGEQAIRCVLKKDEPEKWTPTGHLVLSIMDHCVYFAKAMGALAEHIAENATVKHTPFWARKKGE